MQYMEKKVASPDIFMSIAIGDIDFFKKSMTPMDMSVVMRY